MKVSERTGRLVQATALGLSALLCAAVSVGYWRRPDACAAATFWPAWLWLAPGLALALLGLSRCRLRSFAAVVVPWLLWLGGDAAAMAARRA
jgi:hypothetical protein